MPGLVALADAVKAVLDAAPDGTFTPEPTWLRKYLPPQQKHDMGTVGNVAPAPVGSERSSFTRGGKQADRLIRVGIASPVAQLDDTAIDERVTLIESVIEYLEENAPLGFSTPNAVEIVQLYSEEGVGAGVFLSLFDFTYTTYD